MTGGGCGECYKAQGPSMGGAIRGMRLLVREGPMGAEGVLAGALRIFLFFLMFFLFIFFIVNFF